MYAAWNNFLCFEDIDVDILTLEQRRNEPPSKAHDFNDIEQHFVNILLEHKTFNPDFLGQTQVRVLMSNFTWG
jgi:hypothetical protein